MNVKSAGNCSPLTDLQVQYWMWTSLIQHQVLCICSEAIYIQFFVACLSKTLQHRSIKSLFHTRTTVYSHEQHSDMSWTRKFKVALNPLLESQRWMTTEPIVQCWKMAKSIQLFHSWNVIHDIHLKIILNMLKLKMWGWQKQMTTCTSAMHVMKNSRQWESFEYTRGHTGSLRATDHFHAIYAHQFFPTKATWCNIWRCIQ